MNDNEPKSIMDILSNGTRKLSIEDTMEHVYKYHGKTIKSTMDAIRDEAGHMKPKGISKDMMKVASIPEDVYDMLIQKYGRDCLQDHQFLMWFLDKHPHFKYFPSATAGKKSRGF